MASWPSSPSVNESRPSLFAPRFADEAQQSEKGISRGAELNRRYDVLGMQRAGLAM